jgi:hypothetical protein
VRELQDQINQDQGIRRSAYCVSYRRWFRKLATLLCRVGIYVSAIMESQFF